ncbi:MAG: hypothetical protein NZ556_00805 [Fimbriimonadales bacterium]|nr:hypothetical protein [Fimbriimonadales bacterium]
MDSLVQAKRGLGVLPKQSVAWTVLSKQSVAWTVLSKQSVAWASRPGPVWLGQSCPSTGTDKTVRATCTGWKPVPQMHGQDCPCYAGASARHRRYENLLAFLNSLS